MIKVNSVSTEINYYVSYSNPLLDIASEKGRHSIIKKIMSSFGIRLNDVKFGAETASDKFIFFKKFVDDATNTNIEVSIGIEELAVKIRYPKDESAIYALINNVLNLVKSYKGFDISHQRIVIGEHFSTDEDVNMHFDSLNPFTPDGFEDSIKSKGVIYNLVDNEYGFNTHIVMSNSLLVKEGIYLHLDLQFSPNKLSFKDMFEVVKERYQQITSALGLEIVDS